MLGRFRCRMLSVVSVFALIPTLSYAQSNSTNAGSVEEVVVSGSRIIRDGFQAPTPTTVITQEQFQQQAAPNLIEYLSDIPAFANSQSLQTGQGSLSAGAGISSVNLRNLGSNRTLVLIDGKRSVSSTTSGRVDVNAVPSQLLQRVDVVTGGASAAYGSDAVAGVVNFILDTRFVGFKAEASGGVTNYGDNRNGKVSLTAGIPFAGDRGHFIISGEVTHQQGILVPDRPWNTQGLGFITNPAYGTGSGLTTSVPQRLLLTQLGPTYTKGGIVVSGPLRGVAFGTGGVPYQFNYGNLVSGAVMRGGDWEAQNLRVTQGPSIQPRNTMENFFTRASFELAKDVEIFGQYSWFHSHYFGAAYGKEDTSGLNVPVTNAFLDPAIQARAVAAGLTVLPMGSSYLDQGPMYQSPDYSVHRMVVGAKGSFQALGTRWSWDTYAQLGLSKSVERTINNRYSANFTRALDSVRNPTTGAIMCRSTLTNPSDGCVAYNPFGIGVNSPTQLNYIRADGYRSQMFTQKVIAGAIRGEPFSTWAGPVSVATGVEHRFEAANGRVSVLDQQSALYDGNYKPTIGKFSVTEGFFEAVVPLAHNAPFAQKLDLNAAVRETGYSTSGLVTTWKVGATWTPVSDITIRATQSRDIRAPNINDLFNAGSSNNGSLIDNFPGSNFGNSFTVVNVTRGNLGLVPEVAETTGVGAVFQPSFMPGFQASVDYWRIGVHDAIANITGQQIINLCAQGNQAVCAAINPGTANVGRVVTGGTQTSNTIAIQPVNLAQQIASGIDFEASYSEPLSSFFDNWEGSIRLRGLASYYAKNSLNSGVGAITRTAGQNAIGGTPTWRWQMGATYDANPFVVSLSAHGVSSGVYNTDFVTCQTGCPVSVAPKITVNNNYIPGAVYWDFASSYTLSSGEDGNLQAFLNIKNILNKGAIPIGNTGSFQFDIIGTNQDLYDTDGRVFRIGLRYSL